MSSCIDIQAILRLICQKQPLSRSSERENDGSDEAIPLIFNQPIAHLGNMVPLEILFPHHCEVENDAATPTVLRSFLRTHDLGRNEDYVLVMSYQSRRSGSKKERYLNARERPLKLLEQGKATGRKPFLYVKNVEEMPSPWLRCQHIPKCSEFQVEDRLGVARDQAPKGLSLSDSDLLSLPSDSTYGVAIWCYKAEQPDELDVRFGDLVVCIESAKGWFMARRLSGLPEKPEGIVAPQEGWVPQGCFLKTRVPVLGGGPITPSDILSIHFKATAAAAYTKKSGAEISIKENDALYVYKKYEHWSYVVKADGQRGWVPSWHTMKVKRGSSKHTEK